MSTIHACWLFDARDDATQTAEAMLKASNYWQPDAISIKKDRTANTALAKASLFNTADSVHDQVHEDWESGLLITANARIDNRSELLARLGYPANERTGISTGQLILRAYQHWGEDCPRFLRGDFVFVIWDPAKRQFFCARDHFGVKVLYYATTARSIMITNEHNAFFTSDWLPKQLPESWLVRNLSLFNTHFTEPPYLGVHKLPAAHSMVLNSDGMHLKRYWQLEQQDTRHASNSQDQDYLEELKERFELAVTRRMDTRYPLGAELSEGLDSNGIVGFAAKQNRNRRIFTFSYSCEEETPANEHIWGPLYKEIREMYALHPNIHPVWKTGIPSSAQEQMETLFSAFGGAINIENQELLFTYPPLARKHNIRTMLSGWAGDHCVTSYGTFMDSELLRQGRLFTLHRHFKNQRDHHHSQASLVRAWLATLTRHFAYPVYERLTRSRSIEGTYLDLREKHYLKPEYQKKYGLDKELDDFVRNYRRQYSVQEGEWRELFGIGVENRLLEAELCGRIMNLEYRFPMLDVDLVTFVHNMPSHLKIRQGIERYHFRHILKDITTERNRWRAKSDVALPRSWLEERNMQTKRQIVNSVRNAVLLNTYCDAEKLETHWRSLPLHILQRLEVLKYYEQHPEIPLITQ